MNISESAPCFPSASSQGLPMYPVTEQAGPDSGSGSHSTSLLYNLSILKDKVHEVESLVSIFVTHPQTHPDQSTSLATASMGSLVQEIIVTASSMLFACQQMSLGTTPAGNNINTVDNPDNRICQPPDFGDHSCADNIIVHGQKGQSFYSGTETISWYGDRREFIEVPRGSEITVSEGSKSAATNYDIIELDAADLLAKYTHYCQVCGKGFKRDANLRMHMRAHGDEYKSSAALMNPVKNAHHTAAVAGNDSMKTGDTKYSCPQEGCRWNQKHAKFTPLKSVICVKNHYKRSHCPKMYVCKRCNRKQFSVLSDLRTHEKHCGDLKWQCSCGTTFSRKDKLMGHVALFVGHSPLILTNSTAKPG